MTTIKVTFGHEIRRVTLANQEARGLSSYADFVRTITTLFPQLSDTTVSLIWYDDDGDKITVSSDLEFQEAVRFMDQQPVDGKKVLRFEVLPVAAGVEATPAVAAPSVEVVIHRGITCDECGMSPIHGIRYKCTVRDDYDLCEGCEAKKIQPYPMIKICDPTRSPSAILFAFNDDRAPGSWRRHGFRGPHGHHHGPPGFGPHGHGPHGHGPHGHGPHGHGPHGPGPHGPGPHGPGPHGHGPHGHGPHGPGPHGPGPHGPGPHGPGPHGPGPHGCPRRGGGPHPFAGLFGIPDHKGRESCGGWERRAEKCGRRFGEVVAPFVEAMDKIFADADPVPTEASVAADKVPEDTLEEQLMQEAIQESILLNEVAEAFASVSLPNSESSATAAAAPTTTYASSVQQLPKPALRFVRDLTFPDGTAVQPGASFQKSWRVRNDGKHAWPQDCVLATAGGDLLCPEDLKVALATTAAGEETEITVDLRAPNAPGLYTAYFRAQTKEQQSFGHRLWATILVTEPEDGWMPVSKSDSVSPAISPSASSVTITAAEAAPVVTEVAAAAPVEAPAPVPVAESETPSALPAVVKPLHLLWRRELQVLADMGFVDYDANLPLLQEHLVSPVSLAGDRNAAPSIEGMQRVVGAILANLNA